MNKNIISVLLLGFLVLSCKGKQEEITLTPVDKCEANLQKCTKKIANGEIEFEILPKNSPQLQPLTLTINYKNLKIKEASVVFTGRNMEMGLMPAKLTKIKEGTFQGEGILSICTLYKMEWTAMVSIKTKNKFYKIPFYFSTFNLPPNQ
jgi:hypothetical protein